MKEMKHDSSTLAWDSMGDEWLEMAQTDEGRNCFIMPNMLQFMGDVKGMRILDLGCGEGGYSRELAKRGGQLISVDCSKKAIEHATALANQENLHIEHFVRNFKQISQLSFHRLANGDKSWFSRRFRHLSYREKLRITLRSSAQLSVQK